MAGARRSPLGLLGSALLHAGIIGATLFTFAHRLDIAEESPPVVPVDLVTIAAKTNLMATMTQRPKEEPKEEEKPAAKKTGRGKTKKEETKEEPVSEKKVEEIPVEEEQPAVIENIKAEKYIILFFRIKACSENNSE